MNVFTKEQRIQFEEELNSIANGDPVAHEWVDSTPIRRVSGAAYMFGLLNDSEHQSEKEWWLWAQDKRGELSRAKIKGAQPLLAA